MTDLNELENLKMEIFSIEAKIRSLNDPEENCEPILDGIVNLDKYLKSSLKILWILKEPHDDFKNGQPCGGGWHFSSDFLNPDHFYDRVKDSFSTWHPIIYTTYSLLNGFIGYEEMPYIRNNKSMADIVQNIAFINVKKTPGFTQTPNFSIIEEAYRKNQDILHKQLEIYQPDIIIGGSTLPLFYKKLEINKETDEKKYDYLEFVEYKSQLLISSYHPGQRKITGKRYVDGITKVVSDWWLKKNNK